MAGKQAPSRQLSTAEQIPGGVVCFVMLPPRIDQCFFIVVDVVVVLFYEVVVQNPPKNLKYTKFVFFH